jgi:hypothetical protein
MPQNDGASSGQPEKVELHLATPTAEGLIALFERLSGKKMSPEGQTRVCEIIARAQAAAGKK